MCVAQTKQTKTSKQTVNHWPASDLHALPITVNAHSAVNESQEMERGEERERKKRETDRERHRHTRLTGLAIKDRSFSTSSSTRSLPATLLPFTFSFPLLSSSALFSSSSCQLSSSPLQYMCQVLKQCRISTCFPCRNVKLVRKK